MYENILTTKIIEHLELTSAHLVCLCHEYRCQYPEKTAIAVVILEDATVHAWRRMKEFAAFVARVWLICIPGC